MTAVYGQGMALGASLIIAIGAQNAFVLSQGVRKQHTFIIPLICSIIDAVLISAGVLGVGALLSSSEVLTDAASIGGAAFLLWYGFRSFRASLSRETMEEDRSGPKDLRAAVLFTLAVSLLNPHVYLDTMVLIGSISVQYEEAARLWFGLGAITASFIWFFSLSLGGRLLAPVFRNPKAWKLLDIGIGIIMWVIAFSLIRQVLL